MSLSRSTAAAILLVALAASDSPAQVHAPPPPMLSPPRPSAWDSLNAPPVHQGPTVDDFLRERRLRDLEDQVRRQQQQLDVMRATEGQRSMNPCISQPYAWRC